MFNVNVNVNILEIEKKHLLHLCCKSMMQMFSVSKNPAPLKWYHGILPYFVISDDTKIQCCVLEKYKRGCTEMQVLSEVALRFNLNDSEAVHLRTEVAWRDTSIKKVVLLHLAAWVLKWCSYFLCLADDQPKYCDLPISSYSTETG